ncbi:MAG: glycosyltransferase [Bacteroidales bacterium]|jgi:glycosyltransferase involved in cell wall biosynthesis|nr:glycosyltransferase [Bacteroidales bacterium]
MTVAILQDEIVKGGRLSVLVEMIFILNEKKIIPDIISYQLNLSKNEIRKEYNKEIDFNYIRIAPNLFRKAPETNKLLFNIFVNRKIKSYSLIINSNNTFDFLNKNTNLISYIHYPRKDRVLRNQSLHQIKTNQHFLSKSVLMIDKLIARCLYKLSKPSISNHLIIANSAFTKNAIERQYNARFLQKIKIIYPPVEFFNKKNSENEEITVCSLGRFHPSKRQLEQIKIAKELSQIKFYLIGFADENDYYFRKCKSFIKENRIKNVFLLNNLTYKDLSEKMQESTFFIHTMINEPFGIVTVQAISAGSIPIVHNSGGQKEIVPMQELHYNDIYEIKNIIIKLITEPELREKYQKELLLNIEHYEQSNFINNFRAILNKK